jgi:hypothetical protein
MNRYLAASLVVLSGCAATTLQGTGGCERVRDPLAPAGFTVYSCPHPFIVPALEFSSSSPSGYGSNGGVSTTKLAKGVTNCVDQTIKFWDRYVEILPHEYSHAARCSSGGGKD